MRKIPDLLEGYAPLIILGAISTAPLTLSLVALKDGDVPSSILSMAAAVGFITLGWMESDGGNSSDDDVA